MKGPSLPPGYRYAKAQELNDCFQMETLEAFALAAKKNDGFLDIPDVPGTFNEGYLWKRGHRNHGALRIRERTIEKVLSARKQTQQALGL